MDCFIDDDNNDEIEFASVHTATTTTTNDDDDTTTTPGGTLKGRKAIRDYFASILEEYSDMKYKLVNALPGKDTIAVIYKSTTPAPATTTSHTLYCCEIMYWNYSNNNKISRIIKHYIKKQKKDEETHLELKANINLDGMIAIKINLNKFNHNQSV